MTKKVVSILGGKFAILGVKLVPSNQKFWGGRGETFAKPWQI